MIVSEWQSSHPKDISSATYNVEKTNSLVSPYIGTCKIIFSHEVGNEFTARVEHEIAATFAHQDGTWVAKTHRGTIKSVQPLKGHTPGLEVMKLALADKTYEVSSSDPVTSAMELLKGQWKEADPELIADREAEKAERQKERDAIERQKAVEAKITTVKAGTTTEEELFEILGQPTRAFPSEDRKTNRYLYSAGELVYDIRVLNGVVDSIASFKPSEPLK